MGRYISSYALNIDEVNNVFGSKNFKKFGAVKKARTFFNYDDMTGVASPISVMDAVEDFFLGIKHSAPDEVYSCAVLLLCDALRTALPKSLQIQMGDQTGLINKCLVNDFKMPKTLKIEEILFNVDFRHLFKKPLFIPATFARLTEMGSRDIDLPLIGLWTHSRVRDAQEMFARIQISENEIKTLEKSKDINTRVLGLTYRNIRDLLADIDFCAGKDLGMIHFSY
jgi:hypothetical protein